MLGRANGTNGLPVVAVVVVHVAIARIEVEVPRVVRVVRVERTRPVVAVGPGIVELTVVAVAGSGQEDTTCLRRRYCCFRGQRNALLQANDPIGAIPLLRCGPTAYELIFVLQFCIQGNENCLKI